MILVPNHQQLLNGSKLLVLLIVVLNLFSACEFLRIQPARKPYDPTKDRTVRSVDDFNDDSKTTDIAEKEDLTNEGELDTVAIKPSIDNPLDSLLEDTLAIFSIDTFFTNEDFFKQDIGYKKTDFTFAILLPFKGADFYNASEQDTILKKSKIAVELYEGIIIGVEQLTGLGMNIDAYVFDTENSEATTEAIIGQLYNYSIDLIVGPVYNKNLRIIADYAKRNNIYQLSPLSPSKNITEKNPYFIQVNPTIDSHSSKMATYINNNFLDANIVTISRNTEREMNLASIYEAINGATKIEVNADIELGNYMDANRSNVVIIPSFNELFVNETLRRLNILSQKYNITVFGMPDWIDNMETIDYNYLENLNYHFTDDFYVVEDNEYHTAFYNAYIERFKTKPTKNAYKGFDMMIYFGRMLAEGVELSAHFENPAEKGIYNDFFLQPSYFKNNLDTFDFFENRFVHLLKIKDYKVQKVE